MNVGIICHPTFGGSGVVASELGMGLARRGHQIHIFSHLRPIRVSTNHENVHFHEVEVTTYPLFKYPPYTLSLATKLAVICREESIDILHAHYAIPHAISTYLCRQMIASDTPRLVTTLHGTDITLLGLDQSFFEITRFSLLQSDGLTAVSSDLARQTRKDFEVDREVRVIPNFVDTDKFAPGHRPLSAPSSLVNDGEALIGHLSNFRGVKRVADVVRCFHRIHQQVPSRLILVGDGPDRASASNLIGELGLREKVEFLGLFRDVPNLLPYFDLFLLPSEYESFGLAALEAMSCGVPVVATAVGGLPEVIDHGVSGFLCAVGDIHCMAERGIEILTSSELRERMGKAARQRAEDLFPLERIVRLYEEFYRDVLERDAVCRD